MIFNYHKIYPDVKSKYWVSPHAFSLQMKDLRNKKVVYLDEYNPHNPEQCVITFDDAYENVWQYALPILKDFGFPFEVFIIGKCVESDYKFVDPEPITNFANKDQLKKIVQAGGRLQWHTWSHPHYYGNNSSEIFDHELKVPGELRELCPEGFKWFAYPYGERDEVYKYYAKKYFSGAVAVSDGSLHDQYELNRFTVVENTCISKIINQREVFSTNTKQLENGNMKISVIIPVYNADRYVTEAVESALAQPETAEIILVEDGSLDNSLMVCQQLTARYEKVHLYRHQGGVNRGAAVSRNLGMQKSSYEFIAFLDADDYFLPGRFTITKEIFASNSYCEGVYEALGVQFENDKAKERWQNSSMANQQITTMTKYVSPEELFERLVVGGAGYFSVDGLTIKRSVLGRSGYMNEKLLMHEDTEFIYRLTAIAKLMPGSLDMPVVVRRVHEHNRISEPRSPIKVYHDRSKIYKATYRWCKINGHKEKSKLILDKLMKIYLGQKQFTRGGRERLHANLQRKIDLVTWIFEFPEILVDGAYWKMLFPRNGVRAAIKNWLVNHGFSKDIALINASGLFDKQWYLTNNPDVAQAKVNPLLHYLRYGAFEGRDPSPNFSSAWYLQTYADIRDAQVNPLVHYLRYGKQEGRLPEQEKRE